MSIFLPLLLATSTITSPVLGKGVSEPWNDCQRVEVLNVEWWYDWSPSNTQDCDGFVPMIWSTEKADRILSGTLVIDDSDVVLYLNEPNALSQSNDTPQEATQRLQALQEALPGRKWIVANLLPCHFNPPDCTLSEQQWLDDFLSACSDCQIDAIGVHYYQWSDCSLFLLDHYLSFYEAYGYPILVTEFACLNDDETYRNGAMAKWVEVFEKQTIGYAPFTTYWEWSPFDIARLMDESGELTTWGSVYSGVVYD